MVYCPTTRETSDHFCPCFLAGLKVHLLLCHLETSEDYRVGVVPEPDGVGSIALAYDAGYRLLNSQVSEGIVRVFKVDNAPGLPQ